MVGVCKYCGFSGTNDEMADHASECPVMLQDHQPEDPKLIDRMYKFWFSSKYRFPNSICILIILIQPVLLLILTIYTITLVYLKHRLGNK